MRSKLFVLFLSLATLWVIAPRNAFAGIYCNRLYDGEMANLYDFLQNCVASGETLYQCKQDPIAVDIAVTAADDYYHCMEWAPQEGYPPPSLPSGGAPGGIEVECLQETDINGNSYTVCHVVRSEQPKFGPRSRDKAEPLDCSAPPERRQTPAYRM